MDSRMFAKFVSKRALIAPLLAAIAIVIGSLIPVGRLFSVHLVGDITNAAHYPSGLLLGVVLGPLLQRSWHRAGIVFVLGATLFGAVELIQPWFGRFQSLDDWYKSSAGLAIGLVANFLQGATLPAIKRMVIMAAIAMMIAFSLPLIKKIQMLEAFEHRFPILADFESEMDFALWKPYRNIQLTPEEKDGRFAELSTQYPELARFGGRYARVSWANRDYPEIYLYNVVIDWRGYRKLCFDSRADRDGQSLKIVLGDALQPGLKGAWRQVYANPARWHTTCVEFDHLKADDGRALDLSQLIFVGIAVQKAPDSGWFDLDSIRLMR
ncbi:hypothetical protein HDN1F_10030 [gamma proteobacterium HdN1]|nr:hypothetical protein HDN1F_10030 [gamma proteobacterium HdN1]